MSTSTDIFGQRLKKLRDLRGMTQQEIADQLSVTYQQITKWEAGKHMPAAETIARMAVVLRTSSDYLLNLTDNPSERVDSLTEEETEVINALRLVRSAAGKSSGPQNATS